MRIKKKKKKNTLSKEEEKSQLSMRRKRTGDDAICFQQLDFAPTATPESKRDRSLTISCRKDCV